ncbi:phosphatase PAP2 family protein [Neoaquamicrobium sediminum]|uniref:phosphatase PAP2 family protein n=1 Tax=Neoaquamicrobium sediminum TaxID=1849104 RepID=UPI0015643310|nr:phosphatase PAP2 family protein [Mesorhizobium sediminum]NRC56499.1 phosphatase PAP2 family protein [Mesorhizobium sediminum]
MTDEKPAIILNGRNQFLAAAMFGLLALAFLADMHAIDRLLLAGLGDPGNVRQGSGIVHASAWGLTMLGSPHFFVLASAILVGTLLARREIDRAIFAVLTLAGGAALAYLTKTAFGIAKPHHLPGSEEIAATSFPSGHAVLSLLLVSTLLVLWPSPGRILQGAVWILAAAIVLGVGVSRVFLGTHWPSDVLAGWLFALLWIAAVHRGTSRLGRPVGQG